MKKWTCTALTPDGGSWSGWMIASDNDVLLGFFSRGVGWLNLPANTVLFTTDAMFAVVPTYRAALEAALKGDECFEVLDQNVPKPNANIGEKIHAEHPEAKPHADSASGTIRRKGRGSPHHPRRS
jgi:hypothetical protein